MSETRSMMKKKKKKKGDWIISDFKMAISMNNKYKIEKAVQICDRDAIFFQRENTFTRFIKISFERVYHLDTICFLFFKKDKKKNHPIFNPFFTTFIKISPDD